MTIEDKLCAEFMVRYNKMHNMLCRISRGLGDLCEGEWYVGRVVVRKLRKAVDELLEEL